jgi:hypothetical protein
MSSFVDYESSDDEAGPAVGGGGAADDLGVDAPTITSASSFSRALVAAPLVAPRVRAAFFHLPPSSPPLPLCVVACIPAIAWYAQQDTHTIMVFCGLHLFITGRPKCWAEDCDARHQIGGLQPHIPRDVFTCGTLQLPHARVTLTPLLRRVEGVHTQRGRKVCAELRCGWSSSVTWFFPSAAQRVVGGRLGTTTRHNARLPWLTSFWTGSVRFCVVRRWELQWLQVPDSRLSRRMHGMVRPCLPSPPSASVATSLSLSIRLLHVMNTFLGRAVLFGVGLGVGQLSAAAPFPSADTSAKRLNATKTQTQTPHFS